MTEICVLDGIKFDLLDHLAEIVFNNVKQLISSHYRAAMPSRRKHLLFDQMKTISYCYVLLGEYVCQSFVQIFILLSLVTVNEKEENKNEKKHTKCDSKFHLSYVFHRRKSLLSKYTSSKTAPVSYLLCRTLVSPRKPFLTYGIPLYTFSDVKNQSDMSVMSTIDILFII